MVVSPKLNIFVVNNGNCLPQTKVGAYFCYEHSLPIESPEGVVSIINSKKIGICVVSVLQVKNSGFHVIVWKFKECNFTLKNFRKISSRDFLQILKGAARQSASLLSVRAWPYKQLRGASFFSWIVQRRNSTSILSNSLQATERQKLLKAPVLAAFYSRK